MFGKFFSSMQSSSARGSSLQIITLGLLTTLSVFIPPETQFAKAATAQNTILQRAIDTVPDVPQGVQWDGAEEKFIYSDRNLEKAISTIAHGFLYQPQATATQILQLSPAEQEKFRRNSNTSEAWTRVEPFDLIQGAITSAIQKEHGDVIQSYGGNRIVTTEMVHRAMHLLLELTPEEDSRGASFESFYVLQNATSNDILLFCADAQTQGHNNRVDIGSFQRKSITPLFKTIPISLSELQWNTEKPTVDCNGSTYTVRTEGSSELSPPRAYPRNFFKRDRPLSAFVNFGIVDYFEEERLEQIITFMQAIGYQLQENRVAETLPVFKSELINSDVFIPIAHRLDINFFSPGERNSHLLRFTKTVTKPSGETVPIHLTALFPKKGKVPKRERLESLEKLLSQRREIHDHSLVVINASCQSDVNIQPWMRWYEKSLKDDLKAGKLKYLSDARDMPHVFASTQSFPTGSLANMATNFYHPLNAIEVLAKEEDPRKVLAALDSEPEDGWIGNLLQFWDDISKKGGRVYQNRGFAPVYNLGSSFNQRFHLPSQKILVQRIQENQTQWLEY